MELKFGCKDVTDSYFLLAPKEAFNPLFDTVIDPKIYIIFNNGQFKEVQWSPTRLDNRGGLALQKAVADKVAELEAKYAAATPTLAYDGHGRRQRADGPYQVKDYTPHGYGVEDKSGGLLCMTSEHAANTIVNALNAASKQSVCETSQPAPATLDVEAVMERLGEPKYRFSKGGLPAWTGDKIRAAILAATPPPAVPAPWVAGDEVGEIEKYITEANAKAGHGNSESAYSAGRRDGAKDAAKILTGKKHVWAGAMARGLKENKWSQIQPAMSNANPAPGPESNLSAERESEASAKRAVAVGMDKAGLAAKIRNLKPTASNSFADGLRNGYEGAALIVEAARLLPVITVGLQEAIRNALPALDEPSWPHTIKILRQAAGLDQ